MQPTMHLNPAIGAQSLESRIANLESVLKPGPNNITLQVGTTKIVIASDKIELTCQGTIRINGTKLNLDSQTDMSMRAGANLSAKASSTLLIEASGPLNLKGSTINEN